MLKRRSVGRAVVVVAGFLALGGAPAAAQNDVAAAAKAFSLGQQAELAGDYRAASEHYELADRMVPSPEALRSAAKARFKAGDDAIAATHAELLERRYSDGRSREVASEILTGLRPKLGRVLLDCTPACGVVVDGAALGVFDARDHIFYLEPGRHTIGGAFGMGEAEPEVVEAEAGKEQRLNLVAGQRPTAIGFGALSATHDARRSPGLHVGWFVASGVVTVGLAVGAIWSGLDVLDRNRAYELNPTEQGLEDGQSAELRTNLLMGGTAVMAVVTGLIAWKTRWRGPQGRESAIGVVPAATGALVVFEGAFR